MGGQTGSLAGVALGLTDPPPERLGATSELLTHRPNRRPLRGMFGGVLLHHANRALTQLRGILGWSCHGLHPLSEWALRGSRYGSVRRVPNRRARGGRQRDRRPVSDLCRRGREDRRCERAIVERI